MRRRVAADDMRRLAMLTIGHRQSRALPAGPQPDLRLRRREQRAWYFYDWANSGWAVIVGSLLLGPLLTSSAELASCGFISSPARPCHGRVGLGPLELATGSVASFTVVVATICAALLAPMIGLLVDRTVAKRRVMLAGAWTAALAGALISFLPDDGWLAAAALTAVTAVMLAASLVAADSIMVQISAPSERDRVSATSWSLGYLGGLVVLLVSLGWLAAGPRSAPDGGTSMRAVDDVVLFAALWWGLWTLIPYFGVRDRMLDNQVNDLPRGWTAPLTQLLATLRDLRRHSQALRFLVAFVVFNDGVQSLFAATSVYATRQLGFGAEAVVIALIVVQLVAFVGARAFGLLAGWVGAKSAILLSLVVWTAAPLVAAVVPMGHFTAFLGLLVAIGFVMGGTQSLSRSLYSQLVPAARVAEFFGLFQAVERGTSWLGAFAFGLTYQLSGDYRLAIVVLVGFFLVGAPLLATVRVREGIIAAGNELPAKY